MDVTKLDFPLNFLAHASEYGVRISNHPSFIFSGLFSELKFYV